MLKLEYIKDIEDIKLNLKFKHKNQRTKKVETGFFVEKFNDGKDDHFLTIEKGKDITSLYKMHYLMNKGKIEIFGISEIIGSNEPKFKEYITKINPRYYKN